MLDFQLGIIDSKLIKLKETLKTIMLATLLFWTWKKYEKYSRHYMLAFIIFFLGNKKGKYSRNYMLYFPLFWVVISKDYYSSMKYK